MIALIPRMKALKNRKECPHMKKLFLPVLILCLAVMPSLADGGAVDAVSSASVNDFYSDGILEGDDLMNALNSYSGFYAVASVGADGAPNLGFYIYGCVKLEDVYYLQLGLSPNQTTANIENGSELVAMYAALPAEGATFPTSGARMTLSRVEEEAVLEELLKSAPQGYTPMYYEITSVRPLG